MANTAPIFPAAPFQASASMVAASACTSRAPVAHASLTATPTFAVQLVPSQTSGVRIDKIQVKAAAAAIGTASTAAIVIVWLSDGTNAYPIDEILVPVVTPSAVAASAIASSSYTTLSIPTGSSIWVSTTVAGATSPIIATAFGGTY